MLKIDLLVPRPMADLLLLSTKQTIEVQYATGIDGGL